jgi:hypothetical protein
MIKVDGTQEKKKECRSAISLKKESYGRREERDTAP